MSLKQDFVIWRPLHRLRKKRTQQYRHEQRRDHTYLLNVRVKDPQYDAGDKGRGDASRTENEENFQRKVDTLVIIYSSA